MNVFKLGGASIKDAESIKRLPEIIAENGADRLVLVISALGKTTNKIETIVNKAYKNEDYSNEYNSLKDEHLDILHSLVGKVCDDELVKLFSEFDKKISVTSKADYDYFYDQTVSFGEMFSTLIVAKYLTLAGMDVYLAKANDIFLADKNWRSGNVDIVTSEKRMQQLVQNVRSRIIIIQGFISGTSSNDIVTLGREGSDYSAALVAVFCNAKELTFWKDVDGIYSTDPKIYPDAQKLDKIGYDEMVELSYFGAKILHKKTLSVLKTKNIVARVRSFINLQDSGTMLLDNFEINYPPIKICLKNQILITAESLKNNIILGDDVKTIYDLASKFKMDINMIQISAKKISFCVTYNEHSCESLFDMLKQSFSIKYNQNATLETVRHYTPAELKEIFSRDDMLLTQVSRTAAQVVFAMER